jgi:hypothetical protein
MITKRKLALYLLFSVVWILFLVGGTLLIALVR